MSDSLRPHDPQHARPPCPSPTPGVHPNPCPSSQSYGFSSSHVWMWELDHKEVWVLKDWCLSFELWCWKRPLRVPWTARSSRQSILKEINPEYSLEELMLKVKLQYFGLLMWRANSLGEKKQTNPDAGKDWRQEKRVTEDQLDRWHHWLNGHESE